jgi:hypothetical protein
MDRIIKLYSNTYFSVIPKDILLEMEKYNNVSLLVEPDNGVLYLRIRSLSYTFSYLWKNYLEEFLNDCEVADVDWQNDCVILSYQKYRGLALHYQTFSLGTLVYQWDFITSSIIMKKLYQLSYDINRKTIKPSY